MGLVTDILNKAKLMHAPRLVISEAERQELIAGHTIVTADTETGELYKVRVTFGKIGSPEITKEDLVIEKSVRD